MTSIGDVAGRIQEILDQTTADSIQAALHLAVERTEATMAAFDEAAGADNDTEQVAQVRARLAGIADGIGSLIGMTAGMAGDIEQLAAAWGVPVTIGTPPIKPLEVHTPARDGSTPAPDSRPDPAENGNNHQHPNGLSPLLEGRFKFLHPKRLRTYRHMTELTQSALCSTPVEVADAVVARASGNSFSDAAFTTSGAAALSLYSGVSPNEAALFDKVRSNPAVQQRVRGYVQYFMKSFTLNEGQPLRVELAHDLGIPAGELPAELQGDMPDPPLDLLVLTTDIVVHADNSQPARAIVTGAKPTARMQKCTRDEREVVARFVATDTTRRANDRRTESELHRMDVYLDYQDRRQTVATARLSLRAYLARHYRTVIENDCELAFAAECRIAERIGRQDIPDKLQQSVRTRLDAAWSRLDPSQRDKWRQQYRAACV